MTAKVWKPFYLFSCSGLVETRCVPTIEDFTSCFQIFNFMKALDTEESIPVPQLHPCNSHYGVVQAHAKTELGPTFLICVFCSYCSKKNGNSKSKSVVYI